MTVAIDTNVLVYLHDLDNGAKRDVARHVLRRAAVVPAFLPQQVFAEFIHVATRKMGMAPAAAVASVIALQQRFRSGGVDRDGMRDAAEAHRDHDLQIYDAVIWASARDAGCTHLLSEDFQDGRTLGGVTFVNPFNPTNAELVDRLLPPVT